MEESLEGFRAWLSNCCRYTDRIIGFDGLNLDHSGRLDSLSGVSNSAVYKHRIRIPFCRRLSLKASKNEWKKVTFLAIALRHRALCIVDTGTAGGSFI